MAKNITNAYFERNRPDAVVPAFAGVPADDRKSAHRLFWTTTEAPTDWSQLAKTISDSPTPDSAFVLDSSFLDRHEIPDVVWEGRYADLQDDDQAHEEARRRIARLAW